MMLQVFERLLPNNTEEKEKISIRILQYYLCFTILACFVLGFIQWIFPNGDNTPFFLISGINVLLVLMLKYSGAKVLIGNIYIGIWATILVKLSFETGGVYSMDTMSLSLIPLTGFALINYKSGVGWLVLYVGFIFYLWMNVGTPEMDEYYRAQTLVFDKNYYVLGSLILSTFTFCLFFIFYFQNQRLLGQLKTNQAVLKSHVDKLDKQSILLKKAQADLKRSNTELEEFAYITSHDLKEPLHTVNNFANLLENQLDRKKILDGETSQMLQFIIAGTSKMKNLITDLLAFARLKKEVDITFEKVNLDNLLQSVLFDLKKQIDTNAVEIITPRLPELNVVPVKMNQLFQNLISNAVKFRNKDMVCTIQLEVKELARHWEFSIKDNGIGIPKKHQGKIFQPFKKLHSSSEFEGSGIGLATCMHIVQLHKGQIWVDSEVGEGTTFYFTIAKKITTSQQEKGEVKLINNT